MINRVLGHGRVMGNAHVIKAMMEICVNVAITLTTNPIVMNSSFFVLLVIHHVCHRARKLVQKVICQNRNYTFCAALIT